MADEVASWLTRTALPLSGLTAGVSTADLQPLKGILDGVRVVGLGEANGHITKSRHGGAAPALGQHLHTRYGDAYYALGLLFGSGSFRARRMWPGPWPRPRVSAVVTNRIGPARPGTVEAQLAIANPGNHLVDLRSAVNAPTPVKKWLNGRHGMRNFGAMVPRWMYRFNLSPVSLAEEYDGLA
ncbi:erythromycin esterase family protein [Streptomyces ferrugineus]|uniref:Erythromycin esterase family protein n=1 Tax=Streptomyces ferrugineus TaxID=1413221 RepID=A0A7M2SLX6_9ACTN|nr:erythromycin esterase family protein [Streptomyces ferrugineus]QOV37254.1 erythromycin esterase family protein [Streptomyces ferrugineus]